MNREAVIRAAFFMCKALGRRTSRREVNDVIAALLGKGFRPQEITSVLIRLREPFGNHPGTTTGTATSAQNEQTGTTQGTTGEPATLITRTELLLVESLRSSTTVAARPVAERPPKAQKLPLERDLLDRRNAILRGAWVRIQPLIGRATTYETWRRRNARIATELARLQTFDPAKIGGAWEAASKYLGEPVRELSMVHRFLEAVAVARASENGNGTASRVAL